MGTVHLLLHVAAIVAIGIVAAYGASLWWDGGWWFTVRLLVLMTVLGGPAGGLTVGIYLAVACCVFKAHGNEAFSAMRIEDYKNFLRLHLDTEGGLTVYPIGIRKAHKDWGVYPDDSDEESWIGPRDKTQPPVAHLIEEPFRVG